MKVDLKQNICSKVVVVKFWIKRYRSSFRKVTS